MNDGIKLEIIDRSTGDRRFEEAVLPVEIGKLPGGTSRIILGADRPTISRSHGRIERRGSELIYVDTSSNGSAVAGTRIKGSECRIGPGDVITIEDYSIRIVGGEALTLKLTDAKLNQVSDMRLATDGSCVITQDGDTIALHRPEKVEENAGSVVLELSFDGATVTLKPKAGGDVPEVRINNRIVSLPASASPGDVVAVGQHRVEVLLGGQEKVVCGNNSCHLLNDLPYEENCVWCGFYLAASGSFTRVTPP